MWCSAPRPLLALVRRSSIGPKLAIAALLLVLVSGVALAVSVSTVRGWDPLRHVLADRIVPYPDRLSWWVDHGLPQGAALRVLARDPHHTDTGALTAGPSARDRQFARYSNWVKNKGARDVCRLAGHAPEVHVLRAVRDARAGPSAPHGHRLLTGRERGPADLHALLLALAGGRGGLRAAVRGRSPAPSRDGTSPGSSRSDSSPSRSRTCSWRGTATRRHPSATRCSATCRPSSGSCSSVSRCSLGRRAEASHASSLKTRAAFSCRNFGQTWSRNGTSGSSAKIRS